MASVWKHPESKYWSACFTLPDGRRVKESTKLTNETKAKRVANLLEAEARSGINERDARKLAADLHEKYGMTEPGALELVSKLYERLGGRTLARASVAEYFEQWEGRKRAEVAASTVKKYAEVKRHFLTFLGDGARRDMTSITARDIAAFRDDMAKRLAVGTVNIALKIIRIVFADAARAKLVPSNEAADVPVLKVSSQPNARRAFSEKELRAVLSVAGDEWRAMILTSLYTGGQRLGDVARFTWQNVDLAQAEIRFVTRKTGRRQVIPIAAPLFSCLSSLPSSDDPKAAVFPHAASLLTAAKDEHIGAISNEFHELLVAAGLATAHSHQRTGGGRGARRTVGELCFHSLRHTFTSWAKSAGIGSAIVQDLAGHDSAAISANYTHFDEATKRTALDALPDLATPRADANPRGDAAGKEKI